MVFNEHYKLEGLHAPFAASKSSWLRYDDDKVFEVLRNMKAAEVGTRLHAWAAETIKLGIKQPRSKKTIYSYVNDAIGFNMSTEVVLFYSENFFGTADAISFRNNTLRIHDLKTGTRRVHIEQLEIYAALFCLEYKYRPSDIDIELRIYQSDDILVHKPTDEEIQSIIDRIIYLNKLIENTERGV